MEKAGLESLKAILAADVENYSKSQNTLTDEEKAKMITIINKESSTINDVDRTNSDKADKIARNKLELRKFNFELRQQASKSKQEFDQRNDELAQKQRDYELEKEKFEHDKSEAEKARVDKRIDGVIHLVEIVAPLAVYSALMLMNFRLVYKDRGIEPSEMKDMFKNVTR